MRGTGPKIILAPQHQRKRGKTRMRGAHACPPPLPFSPRTEIGCEAIQEYSTKIGAPTSKSQFDEFTPRTSARRLCKKGDWQCITQRKDGDVQGRILAQRFVRIPSFSHSRERERLSSVIWKGDRGWMKEGTIIRAQNRRARFPLRKHLLRH